MTHLQQIITSAKEELRENFHEHEFPEDLVHEVADSHVPIYSHDLMTLGSDPQIFFHENELPPAFDGQPTLNNIVATAVYELISEALYEELYKLQQELDEAA